MIYLYSIFSFKIAFVEYSKIWERCSKPLNVAVNQTNSILLRWMPVSPVGLYPSCDGIIRQLCDVIKTENPRWPFLEFSTSLNKRRDKAESSIFHYTFWITKTIMNCRQSSCLHHPCRSIMAQFRQHVDIVMYHSRILLVDRLSRLTLFLVSFGLLKLISRSLPSFATIKETQKHWRKCLR